MIAEVGSLLTTPCCQTYHDNRGRLSAHHTLLPNMYHDNRGRQSAPHTLQPNMYHDNRGRLSAHHILQPNMYHDNRGRLSALHTLLPNMYHDNRGRLSMITEVGSLLTTPCYLTCTMITAGRTLCSPHYATYSKQQSGSSHWNLSPY